MKKETTGWQWHQLDHMQIICTLLQTNNNASTYWLLDKVLRPTQHKTGHFGDVPQANLLAWYGKAKPNTTKAHSDQSKITVLQHKINIKS